MKNIKIFPFVISAFFLFGSSTGCKKETPKITSCFTFGGDIVFDTNKLVRPIDSLFISVTNDSEYHPETRRYGNSNLDYTYTFGTEACGLYHYKVEVYNSDSNPPISILLRNDLKTFLTQDIKGSGIIEGTLVLP